MRYLTSDEIYRFMFVYGGKYLPCLPNKEKLKVEFLALTVTHIANVLNTYPSWRQFFMFDEKDQYKQSREELESILEFYAIDENTRYKYHFIPTKGIA